ncbi:MAG TPA: DUF983 domain-containing protein [Chthoniobacterales bacterium]|nr:DUF983 domain-containing protein [Chthoniobacterales bacterium]
MTTSRWQIAWLYFYRALALRCPLCGKSPIFIPLKKTRSLRDWFIPLDGCPRCGYPYTREPGYFLLATWAGSYGSGSLLGLAIYFFLDWKYNLEIWTLLTFVLIPVILFNILFARHAKAFFLAFDHFFDPYQREDGKDGGNLPLHPPTPILPTGDAQPVLPPKKKLELELKR